MIIQSKIERANGTSVDLFGKRYEFKPNGSGDHVCEVTDQQAIERFLAVTEGYCEYKAGGKNTKTNTAEAKPPVDDELDDDEIELSVEPIKQSDEMSEDEARQAYVEKFGKNPHHAMKLENIIKAVSE